MGIKALGERARPMSVDDVLEGLRDKDVRATLETALSTKQPNGYRYVWPAHEVSRALQDDGFEVSTHQVEKWRRDHDRH